MHIIKNGSCTAAGCNGNTLYGDDIVQVNNLLYEKVKKKHFVSSRQNDRERKLFNNKKFTVKKSEKHVFNPSILDLQRMDPVTGTWAEIGLLKEARYSLLSLFEIDHYFLLKETMFFL